uniref:Uncharacterized protein n=1 Tax=Timema genevievae TaxID=629358 RepID=A0A7R9PR63_TIMGE|nr:unnamed protein product [Timema genevievae]
MDPRARVWLRRRRRNRNLQTYFPRFNEYRTILKFCRTSCVYFPFPNVPGPRLIMESAADCFYFLVLRTLLVIGGVEKNPGPKRRAAPVCPKDAGTQPKQPDLGPDTKELLLQLVQTQQQQTKLLQKLVDSQQEFFQEFHQKVVEDREIRAAEESKKRENAAAMEELKRSQNAQRAEKVRLKDAELTTVVERFNLSTNVKDWDHCVNILEWCLDSDSLAYIQLQDLKTDSSPLYTAAKYGYRAILAILLQHGLNVNLGVDTFNNSMLHIAVDFGQISVVNLLLDHRADVNAPDSNGDSILFWAAKNGNLEMVEVLVHHGADVNALDIQGCSVLHYCASNGNLPLVQFLIEHGAENKAVVINDGLGGMHYNVLPLNLAKKKQHRDIVDYLSSLNNF